MVALTSYMQESQLKFILFHIYIYFGAKKRLSSTAPLIRSFIHIARSVDTNQQSL